MSAAARQFRTHSAAGESEGSKHCLYRCSMKATSASYQFVLQCSYKLGVPLCKRMQQISYGKQGEAKNSTPKVEVVTHTMLRPPLHPRTQMKCFAEMGENDHHQTSCTEQL